MPFHIMISLTLVCPPSASANGHTPGNSHPCSDKRYHPGVLLKRATRIPWKRDTVWKCAEVTVHGDKRYRVKRALDWSPVYLEMWRQTFRLHPPVFFGWGDGPGDRAKPFPPSEKVLGSEMNVCLFYIMPMSHFEIIMPDIGYIFWPFTTPKSYSALTVFIISQKG